MTGIYVLLAICIVLIIVVGALIIMNLKNKGSGISKMDIKEENDRLKDSIDQSIKYNNSVLNSSLNSSLSQSDNLKRLDERLDNMSKITNESIAQLKDSVNQKVLDMQKENTRQLEEMRKTVDQKLTESLDQKFSQSFKLVNDRLIEINSTFNALQGLQNDVNDLGKIFKNVKTRGTWGELSLDSLLSQILVDDQYCKQFPIKSNDETGRVDFAIKLPGKGDGIVYLPVDAKFPLDDYERLIDASSKGAVEDVDRCQKALLDDVLKQAKSIKEKYIKPPKTTDFAIMYVPIEGLYAEVVKSSEILTKLQSEKVVICGPTTLSALLNSLRMGFKSVAIEKRSKEIQTLLEKFQKDFADFSKYLGLLKDRMNTVQKTIDDATKKSDKIGNTLAKVTQIELPDDTTLEGDMDSYPQDNLLTSIFTEE